ncbi:MAG: hypothetical protein NC321_15490 [Clostridium sp.]|nr:hypothetical protein [Clostridium sp.]
MSIENLAGKNNSKKSGITKKQQDTVEDTRYYGAIPDDVLEEMTPEIIEQYYLWDEVAKKEVERYPWLILPLIQETFHKTYPENVQIRLITTEYVVRRIHKDGGSTLNSIFADIAVQIENRDIYHMECQMDKEKGMVLRMLEYDIHIGLVHGTETENKNIGQSAFTDNRHELIMPRSVILYLNDTDSMPAEETCLIRFADGTTHEYRVPVMNVQSYTTEMIEKKHLNMLIPFLPIRFRKYLNRKRDGIKQPPAESVRKDLTKFIRECIMIIDREKENGTLTEMAGKEMIGLLDITCSYLLKNEPELKKEVHGVMRPIVMTNVERAEIAEREIKLITERMAEHNARTEKAIRKFIEKYSLSGQSRQEVKESIQDIFSLDEAEAEEKMKQYWVQADE